MNQKEINSYYIHWPFCPYKCHFCPFVALASHDQFMSQYHNALKNEITQYWKNEKPQNSIETIFFGGGTPSTYPNELLLDTFGILKVMAPWSESIEITIEVNPGTVKRDQLQVWKACGINRLSIGVQSMNDKVFKDLNRHQRAQDVIQLLSWATDFFDNISIDLIVGLPGVTNQEWKGLINQVINWPINHISVYLLTVHESTPLFFKVNSNKVTLLPDEELIELYWWTIDQLSNAGFEQYELSNFAKPGFESRHNSAYWDRKAYRGFGLGACSFDGNVRFQNNKNLLQYMQAIEKNEKVIVFEETLTEQQENLEKLMLNLRRKKGVTFTEVIQGAQGQKYELVETTIKWLLDQKFIKQQNGRFSLTPQGLVVENEIIARLSC